MLRFLEIGEHVREAPARVSKIAPMIVVCAVPAHIDHGIDRAAATQHFASGPEQLAVFQIWLRLGVETPVTGGLKQLGEGNWNMDLFAGIRSACLQQQYLNIAIFTQAAGQNASGGTGPNNNVVVHHCASGLGVKWGQYTCFFFVTTEEQNLLAVGLLDYSVKPLKHGIPSYLDILWRI